MKGLTTSKQEEKRLYVKSGLACTVLSNVCTHFPTLCARMGEKECIFFMFYLFVADVLDIQPALGVYSVWPRTRPFSEMSPCKAKYLIHSFIHSHSFPFNLSGLTVNLAQVFEGEVVSLPVLATNAGFFTCLFFCILFFTPLPCKLSGRELALKKHIFLWTLHFKIDYQYSMLAAPCPLLKTCL